MAKQTLTDPAIERWHAALEAAEKAERDAYKAALLLTAGRERQAVVLLKVSWGTFKRRLVALGLADEAMALRKSAGFRWDDRAKK